MPYFVSLKSYLGPTRKVSVVDKKAMFQKSFELLLKLVQYKLHILSQLFLEVDFFLSGVPCAQLSLKFLSW